jgi:hypothetical protein
MRRNLQSPVVYNKTKLSSATRGFTLHLGVSANYYQGKQQSGFETDRLGWQINGMLGWF